MYVQINSISYITLPEPTRWWSVLVRTLIEIDGRNVPRGVAAEISFKVSYIYSCPSPHFIAFYSWEIGQVNNTWTGNFIVNSQKSSSIGTSWYRNGLKKKKKINHTNLECLQLVPEGLLCDFSKQCERLLLV